MTQTDHTIPAGASLHLGGHAYAHPALEPALVPIDTVTPYPDNPRRGDQDAITSSIRDLGLYAGVVAQHSTGHILVGNHRRHALTELGAERIPVTYVDVDDTRAAAIVARDNLTSDRGGYDDAALLALLQSDEDVLALSGYTVDDTEALRGLLAAAERAGSNRDPDDTPPPPVVPLTREGDIWLLGRHRLMCGSGLDESHLTRLLDGASPDLIYTDPPYGIDIVNRPSGGMGKVGGSKPVTIKGKVGHALGSATGFDRTGTGQAPIVRTKWYDPVIGDETTATAVQGVELAQRLWPKARQVWWGANHYAGDAPLPNGSCWLVWDKATGENTFADAELAWTNHKGAVRLFTHQWNGLLRASERGSTARVHPTQKPVALAVWAFGKMLGATVRDAVILDQFGGSGSTLIAAEQVQAQARVMELSPAYVDVICRRYQQHTGIVPVRDGVAVDFLGAEVPSV